MSALSNAQVVLIARCAALLAEHRDVLSPFEAELILEVGERFLHAGRLMAITGPEEEVLTQAERAMAAAARAAAAVGQEAAA